MGGAAVADGGDAGSGFLNGKEGGQKAEQGPNGDPGKPCAPKQQLLAKILPSMANRVLLSCAKPSVHPGTLRLRLARRSRESPVPDGQAAVQGVNTACDPGCELLAYITYACNFWVSYAATTNQEFEVNVTDTQTGQLNRYFNPLDRPAPPVQDTDAFATCP
jgi:hypothetical protein